MGVAPIQRSFARPSAIRDRNHIGPVTLCVNSGIGCTSHPVRFACPPEVTLLTLQAAG